MLIGTYTDTDAYTVVLSEPAANGTTLVIEERGRGPGAIDAAHVRASFATDSAARQYAIAHLLACGGQLAQSPTALACSPVPRAIAKQMLTRVGRRRYLHVVAGARD